MSAGLSRQQRLSIGWELRPISWRSRFPAPAQPARGPLSAPDSPSASFDVAGVSGAAAREEGPGEGAGQQEGRGEGRRPLLPSVQPQSARRWRRASLERFQMFPGRVCNFLLSSPSRPLGLVATRLA